MGYPRGGNAKDPKRASSAAPPRADFYTSLQVARPLKGFPCPLGIGVETRHSSAYRFRGADRKGGQHCIFQYTLSGQGVFWERGVDRPLPPGTGFLCVSDDPDTGYHYPPNGRERWQFMFTVFGGAAGFEMTQGLVARHGGVHRLPLDHPVITRLLAFGNHPSGAASLSGPEGARLVCDLLCALGESADAVTESSPASDLVRRAREEMEIFVENRLDVDDIATSLRVSREHLTRLFTREMGVPPGRYLLSRKISIACRLLRDEGLSVKETAERLGFDSSAHFIRAFKRLTHATPGAVKAGEAATPIVGVPAAPRQPARPSYC